MQETGALRLMLLPSLPLVYMEKIGAVYEFCEDSWMSNPNCLAYHGMNHWVVFNAALLPYLNLLVLPWPLACIRTVSVVQPRNHSRFKLSQNYMNNIILHHTTWFILSLQNLPLYVDSSPSPSPSHHFLHTWGPILRCRPLLPLRWHCDLASWGKLL